MRNSHAIFGLTGTALASRTKAAGEVAVGSKGVKDYSESCILYTVRIDGITNAIVPVLNLLTGVVTENGATATDEGVTFEGRPVSLLQINAIQVERVDSGVVTAITATGNAGNVWKMGPAHVALHAGSPAQPQIADTTMTFAMNSSAEAGSVLVTVMGIPVP